MSIFFPTKMLHKISEITPEMMAKLKISALILDVDNTLTTHNNPIPDVEVLKWLSVMKKAKIKMIIASNNSSERVRPFAEELELDFAANAAKPLPFGFNKVAKRLGIDPKNFGVVGDQIFTDILGGNLFGAKTLLVQPLLLEENPMFKIKRKLETVVLKAYRKDLLGKDNQR